MPSAPKLEAPQGQPLFDVQFRAISESLAGNGVLANGDLQVTDGTNALEIDVAAGTLYYVATEYNYAGAAPAATLSAGDATYDRWDTVAFDTGTGSVVVHEGTPEQYPSPPDISGGEVLLAIVYVAAGASDIGSADILNWRAKFSNEAEEVHYDDGTGDYGVDNVDAALDAIDLDFVRGRDNTITGVLGSLGTNPGLFGSVIDATVDGNSAAGTEHSYTLSLDATDLVKLYTESDGAGGIQNTEVRFQVGTSLPNGDIVTSEIAADAVTATELADAVDLDTMRGRDNTITGTLAGLGTNPGSFGALIDATVDGNSAAGTVHKYAFDIDATDLLVVAAESDGAGGIQNPRVTMGAPHQLLSQTGAPGHTGEGAVFYDSDENTPKYSDGANYQRPLPRQDVEHFDKDETGTVNTGNIGVVWFTNVPNGSTLEVLQAGLLLDTLEPVPGGVDLVIYTGDNAGTATHRATILSGDGATVFDDETGSPLASWNNATGGALTTAIGVDNGQFNAGSGAAQDIATSFIGRVV